MSCHIVIKKWSGADPTAAARKLAKVFKMDMDKAHSIMLRLSVGQPWRFERRISETQGRTALEYLTALGFSPELAADWQKPKPPPESAGSAPGHDSAVAGLSLEFHGSGAELFEIVAVNQLLTLLTLGFYHFWAKTKVRRYLMARAALAGDPFAYQGSGTELFLGFLKFLGVALGLALSTGFLQSLAGRAPDSSWGIVSSAAPALAVPYFMAGAWNYRLSRTSWRGIRFSFRGERRTAVLLYARGWVLTALTLGLYAPFFSMQAQKFWRRNAYFGNLPFEFTGTGKDIFRRFLLAWALTVPTLGVYWIWYKAYVQRYVWERTHLAGGTFRFTATGGEWLRLYSANLLALIFSLGLAYSWVIVRNQRFLAERLTLEGTVQLQRAIQEMKDSGAMGEEALDLLDAPMDII